MVPFPKEAYLLIHQVLTEVIHKVRPMLSETVNLHEYLCNAFGGNLHKHLTLKLHSNDVHGNVTFGVDLLK